MPASGIFVLISAHVILPTEIIFLLRINPNPGLSMKKTIASFFFLTVAGLLMLMLVLAINDHINIPQNSSLPQNFYRNPTFFESLVGQGIQNLKQPTSLLILQIVVILLVSRITAYVFSFIGQPAVMGETIGGILLGPSLLGWLAPGASHFLFPPESLGRLQSLSQLGLIIYMFLVGMEIDLGKLRSKASAAVLIGHAGIVFPFTLGMFLSLFLYQDFCPVGIGFLPFALFIGVAMSITAFPVLARIVKEKKLSGTMVGTVSIASAAIEDVTAWSVLALIIAVAKSTSVTTSIISLLLVLLFILIMFYVVRPLLQKYHTLLFHTDKPDIPGITFVVAILLLSAITTDVLGVHAVFGAFIAGLIMPVEIKVKSPVKTKFEDFTTVLLLPIFFALTGLKTQLGLLNSGYLWGVFTLVLLVAVSGKMGGVVIAARFSKIKWRDSIMLGILMNTRGLMELIALNIGYDLGVISGPIFTLMVLMAIITTFMTGPLLNLIMNKDSFTAEPLPEA